MRWEKHWYLMNSQHGDGGISATAVSTLGPHQALWLQLSNKISLLYWGTSWQENLTSADRELLFPSESLRKQFYALVDKAQVCDSESPLIQQKWPPSHNALHLKSGARWTAPVWHLTAFIFRSMFLINCQIGSFTRNHKCRQMSRKCQGLRREGNSGSARAH